MRESLFPFSSLRKYSSVYKFIHLNSSVGKWKEGDMLVISHISCFEISSKGEGQSLCYDSSGMWYCFPNLPHNYCFVPIPLLVSIWKVCSYTGIIFFITKAFFSLNFSNISTAWSLSMS